LAKKQAANKLEKFIAERIEEKIDSLTVDSQIHGKRFLVLAGRAHDSFEQKDTRQNE